MIAYDFYIYLLNRSSDIGIFKIPIIIENITVHWINLSYFCNVCVLLFWYQSSGVYTNPEQHKC